MNLGEDKNADDARKDNMFHPIIENKARDGFRGLLEDVNLIAYRIFRFGGRRGYRNGGIAPFRVSTTAAGSGARA
jgi:hypothetical protein